MKLAAAEPGFFSRLEERLALKKFFHWWAEELRALLPKSLRTSGSLGKRLLIQLDSSQITLYRLEEGEIHELGYANFKADDPEAPKIAFQSLLTRHGQAGARRFSLYLPAGQVLRKVIQLPLPAEENLSQVLSFELDRHTPFKPEQVYFDHKVLKRDTQANIIHVEVAVAQRDFVNRAMTLLATWGVELEAVLVAGDLHTAPHFNLLPLAMRPPENPLWRVTQIALALVAFTLLMLALAIPLWQTRQETIALFPVVNKARIAAQDTDALHRQLENLSARHNFLLQKKRAAPPVTILLNEITRLLPDDTWVQQFELKGRELQLVGETASSSKLIGILEQSTMLDEASYRSPLTKVQPGSAERFHLSAVVQPLTSEDVVALAKYAGIKPVLPPLPAKPPAVAAPGTPTTAAAGAPAAPSAAAKPPATPAAPPVKTPTVPATKPPGAAPPAVPPPLPQTAQPPTFLPPNPVEGARGNTPPAPIPVPPATPAPTPPLRPNP
mgnify:CR=1 FL=1